MFGRKTLAPTPVSTATPEPKPETDWAARYEELAREAEPSAIERGRELFSEFQAHHRTDKRTWAFDCRRHGDFLALFVTRTLTARPWDGVSGGPTGFVEAVNLSRVSNIRLRLGRAPDMKGELNYLIKWVTEDGQSTSRGHYKAPSRGWKAAVEPMHSASPYVHSPIHVEAKSGDIDCGNIRFGDRSTYTYHKTPDAPRHAKDDVIQFVGSGVSLRCPAGTGQATYDAILAALAAGAPKIRKVAVG